MFTVENISLNDAGLLEQLGTKEKFWVWGKKALFKIGRAATGENWAEVVAAEVARRLGLPHAPYQLAECNGSCGVLTQNFTPEGSRLVLGNELLAPIATEARNVVVRREHTVGRVQAILRQSIIDKPIGWSSPSSVTGASGVFAGYVMLDALIGNQDRHEENWGLIISPPKYGSVEISLAPTFDHAASLGRNETDKFRAQKINDSNKAYGVEAYTRKAKSQFYRNGKRIKTIQAFLDFRRLEKSSTDYWIERLSRLSRDSFEEVLEFVPDDWITAGARRFAVEMMVCNKNRIMELSR